MSSYVCHWLWNIQLYKNPSEVAPWYERLMRLLLLIWLISFGKNIIRFGSVTCPAFSLWLVGCAQRVAFLTTSRRTDRTLLSFFCESLSLPSPHPIQVSMVLWFLESMMKMNKKKGVWEEDKEQSWRQCHVAYLAAAERFSAVRGEGKPPIHQSFDV